MIYFIFFFVTVLVFERSLKKSFKLNVKVLLFMLLLEI